MQARLKLTAAGGIAVRWNLGLQNNFALYIRFARIERIHAKPEEACFRAGNFSPREPLTGRTHVYCDHFIRAGTRHDST
jgi:hypothetical protein